VEVGDLLLDAVEGLLLLEGEEEDEAVDRL
jgi:hypothetical protein